jgi:hypothetical protein
LKLYRIATSVYYLLGRRYFGNREHVPKRVLSETQIGLNYGYTWLIDIPHDFPEPETGELQALRDRVQSLEPEREAQRREVQELHVLLKQAQAALPAPVGTHRLWWQFWQQ